MSLFRLDFTLIYLIVIIKEIVLSVEEKIIDVFKKEEIELAHFDISDRNQLRKIVIKNKHFNTTIKELDSLYEFMDLYTYQQFNKDFSCYRVKERNFLFSYNYIIVSALKTLLSIITILEYGNISDAIILSRRYREDLFYYLWMKMFIFESDNKKINSIIENWLNNNQRGVHFNRHVLQPVLNDKRVLKFVKNFNIDIKLAEINNLFNNYTHWNGTKYYNKYAPHSLDYFAEPLNQLKNSLYYLTTVFVYMNAIINPGSIMSNDYIDQIEMNAVIDDELKYEVAPFIYNFLLNHEKFIGENAFIELKKYNCMNL